MNEPVLFCIYTDLIYNLPKIHQAIVEVENKKLGNPTACELAGQSQRKFCKIMKNHQKIIS